MLNFPIYSRGSGSSSVSAVSRFPWIDAPNIRGDMNFDGVTDFTTLYGAEVASSISRSGSTYTINAAIFAGAVTVAAGVTLAVRGCPIICTSFTCAGTLSCVGSPAIGFTGGSGAFTIQANADGYPGGDGGAEGAGAAYGPDNLAQLYGGEGGTGGLSSDGVGSAANDPTWNTPRPWFTRTLNQGHIGLGPYWKTWSPGTFDGGFYGAGGGGGGGGPTSGLTTARGGGGGGGGGMILVIASVIVLEATSILTVQGGAGGAGESDAGGSGGGGGGGGGGLIYFEYESFTNAGTLNVLGGAGGAAGGVASTDGATGNDGVVIQVEHE